MAVLLLATCIAATSMSPSWSTDHADHERARQAVQAGEILTLPVLLERLERVMPGQVLEVELEHDAGRWIYEIKLLKSGGGLVKVKLDARTGALMQSPRERRSR